ncbi:right-handed parallel beta-helix repeat-containing protein [Luteolibacter ambystomatis]|uniref:non-specific serine/threonine protein kinase n=1 Tax=Luteolibacter ambystomatis TaxID=2824561 RepID=A0A975IZS2_9BACT|nr:right-handed parallel beta-helix repeat-containing protein [Luteolibacter ambystomatis]QUE50085.1 right-handed parallel beta-helix repeat-containing protein [Luteolibacter ambystomatis]
MVQPGEKFGNYEVLSNPSGAADVLGSGSGGTTLKVKHVHLDTIAALKILRRRAQADSRQGQSFLAEARSAASLTHPHIARILDFGENAGLLYYVMDLCEGGSLEDFRNAKGTPPPAVALAWFHQSAAALGHAHSQNILHRDIKPSNLLIAREGDAASLKLIDFGLAGKTDTESGNPANDPVIGTPLFAAPEQLRGQAAKASDVFSLGAAFLWLLTGSHLDTGDLSQVLDRRLAAQTYAPLLVNLPPAWQEAIGAFLQVDPALRPADGAAAVAVIERAFAADFPVQPVPWSVIGGESAAATPAVPENPADAWEQADAADWRTVWSAVDAPAADGCRILFKATSPKEEGTWDVQLFEKPDPSIEELVVPQGHLLKRHAAALGLGRVVLHRGEGWLSVAWPALTGKDALDWLRLGGVPPASDLLPRIRALATGLDLVGRDGLDAMEMHPALLHLLESPEQPEATGFAIAVFLPSVTAEKSSRETASTISGSVNAPLPIRFAACLYHLLGGRPLPPAAFLNNRAYPAVPRLSERSNRYLGQVVSGLNPAGSCGEIVDRLSMEERLPGVTGMASETVSRSMYSPSVSMSAGATVARSMETLAKPPQLPGGASASVSTPPPVAGATATATAVPAKPKPVKLIVAIAAVLLLGVIGVGGAVAWWWFKKPSQVAKQTVANTPQQNVPTTTTPTRNDPTPSQPPPTASDNSLKQVKVPGQAATLAEAVAKCAPGGTIEIAGGTYKEAISITKAITLNASDGAVIENAAATNSLVAIKGKVEVKISGLVIRDARREATGSPESSPPLVLVADGANATLDRCVIDGGMGSGVSMINKATVRLSGCRVLRNRWCGLQASAGASVDLDQGSVSENRCGILASDPGTTVRISSGSIVSRNSRNGIEVSGGAGMHLVGCEVSNSQSGCGILVSGEGSSLNASGKTSICDNKTSGIESGSAAILKLSDCQLERNREHGIHAEKGGAITVESSRFENGLTGLFADGGGAAVKVDRCEFAKHGDSGVVFAGVKADLSNSTFTGNSVAAIFADGASGSAKSNKVSPGPVDDAIVLDNAGQVAREGNTAE